MKGNARMPAPPLGRFSRLQAAQSKAKVLQPTQTGVDESPATVLTYQIIPTKGQSAMTPEATTQTSTTNLILYGPPGTGKTHHTAWESVRLCLGDAEAERFRGDENRVALMEDEKRIDFVTFHQAMSYEEFVEGLRPATGRSHDPESPQEDEVSAGFRLEPQGGILKRMSERAASERGDVGAGGLDRTRRIYRLGLTGGDWRADLQKAVEEKEISWGFGGDTDWSAPEYEDWEASSNVEKSMTLRSTVTMLRSTERGWCVRARQMAPMSFSRLVGTGLSPFIQRAIIGFGNFSSVWA